MDYIKLKNKILKKPSMFFLLFISYIILNGVLNKIYVTVPNIFVSFSLWFSIPFVLMNFLFVPFLVSLTLIFSFEKFKDLNSVNKKRGMFSVVGIFGSLLGGACPGCFVGLFPAFIGLFGVTATLSTLPFYGLEIQFLSAIILVLSLNYLTKPTVCLIK